MTDNEGTRPDENDEEDWMKYADAGFGETDYSLWDDEDAVAPVASEENSDMGDLAFDDQLDSHMEEIPRAPSPAGHKHLVRLGTCDACLGRVGGKKRFGQSLEESGGEVRVSVLERDSHLSSARADTPLCPFCENLFEEVDLLADIIYDALKPYELKRLQLGARFPKDQTEGEDVMRKQYGAGGSDPLKSSLVAQISRRLNERTWRH